MMRFRELDALRGIAALAVVASHFTGEYNSRYPQDPSAFADIHWGAYGVQLFFVISGFVILMTATRARRPGDFVISRVSRLYPAYWMSLGLAVVVAVVVRVPGVPLDPWVVLANLTMVQRWIQVDNVNDVYWTLAVEMQFYVLIFALVLATRCRVSDRSVRWTVLAWLLVSVAVSCWAGQFSRGLSPQAVPLPAKLVLNATLAEYGPLFSTGMLAFMSRRDGRLHGLTLVCAASAVACAGLLHGWTDALWVAGICGAFILVAMRPSTGVLTVAPLQWLGRTSYSLYIVHSILGFAIIRGLWPLIGRDVAMFCALVAVLLVAWAFRWLGEEKLSGKMRSAMLRLRERNSVVD